MRRERELSETGRDEKRKLLKIGEVSKRRKLTLTDGVAELYHRTLVRS
jgi:hypothetical protein